MKNKPTKILLALMTVTGLFTLQQVHAFNPVPEPPQSVPIGIDEFQTAVINVGVPPDPLRLPEPIRVQLALYDAAGNLLRTLRTRVSPGQVVSMEVERRNLRLRQGGRLTIYGIVQCLGNAASKVSCAQSIKPSMELFDNDTRRTSIVVPMIPAIVPVVGTGE